LASCIEANDPSDDFCPAIGFYGSESAGQKNIYFWTGADSGNQRNPGSAWVDYTALLGDSFQIRTNLQMARGNALPGNIIMDSQNIQGMGEPVDPSDATTKNYVDVADASLQSQITANANGVNARLPLAGGTMTGAISMGGSRITNVGVPIQSSDVASKGYVDANAGDANIETILTRGNNANGQNLLNIGTLTTTNETAVNISTTNLTASSVASVGRLTHGISYTGEINTATGGSGQRFDIPAGVNIFHFLFRRTFPTDYNDSRVPDVPVGTIIHCIGSSDSGVGFMRFFDNSDTGYTTPRVECGNNERLDLFRTSGGWIYWKFSTAPGANRVDMGSW